MKYIDINFVKPDKDCIKENNRTMCNDEYVCFDCESKQVKNKYPDARWDLPDWVIIKQGGQSEK